MEQRMVAKYDYTNKTVYIGIDVHKTTYVCVAICEGTIVKKDSLPAKPESLVSYLQNTYKDSNIKTCYEAGFSGFHLHRYLVGNEIDNKVIHPASLEVASRDKTKTDKRDAKKMAEHLYQNRIEGIYIPSVDQESERNLSRLRRTLVKMQRQTSNRIKSLLHTRGLIPLEDERTVGKKWLTDMQAKIKRQDFHPDFVYTYMAYKNEWLSLHETLREIQKKLMAKVSQDNGLRAIYKSAPGIGDIHCNEIADELGDMKQFKSEKSLYNFLGLTPSEYSSGERIRQGNISRQGRSILRAILIEAAWVAIGKDNSLLTIFKRIEQTRGSKRAIVGVARRLAGRLRSCVLSGSIYKIEPITA